MMGLNEILMAILLGLSSVLIVVLIILFIKLLYTTKKLDIILTDVQNKLNSVNGVFKVIDIVTDSISDLCDTIFLKTGSLIRKIFKKKKIEEEEQ